MLDEGIIFWVLSGIIVLERVGVVDSFWYWLVVCLYDGLMKFVV